MSKIDQDEQTYSIPVIQFLRPLGQRRHEEFITTDRKLFKKANAIVHHGWQFESEILTTGHVHLAVSNFGRDIVTEIAANTTETVEAAMRKLIERGYREIVGDES